MPEGFMSMSATDVDENDILASINVTPLVDIFLVLLIIFMITSTVLDQKEIPVSLPKAAHAGNNAPKACNLVLNREDKLFLDGVPVDSAQAMERLRNMAAKDTLFHVLISADEDLAYRRVVGLIDMVRASGVNKYALKVMRYK
jgi:biopolymer transport protein ExbD